MPRRSQPFWKLTFAGRPAHTLFLIRKVCERVGTELVQFGLLDIVTPFLPCLTSHWIFTSYRTACHAFTVSFWGLDEPSFPFRSHFLPTMSIIQEFFSHHCHSFNIWLYLFLVSCSDFFVSFGFPLCFLNIVTLMWHTHGLVSYRFHSLSILITAF